MTLLGSRANIWNAEATSCTAAVRDREKIISHMIEKLLDWNFKLYRFTLQMEKMG
jgi:hypothetical protein